MKKEKLRMQIESIRRLGKDNLILIYYILDKKIKHNRLKLHEYLLNSIARIESTLFLDPYRHETKVSQFLYGTRGRLFVDVGANLGRYEVLLGKNYERIIAIEPSPENMSFLKRNAANVKAKNIEYLQCAVSSQNGNATLFYGEHCGANTLMSADLNAEGLQVKTVTLDTLLKEEDNVDLVKVDVEGAEWEVLAGSKEVLPKIKRWLVEVHNLEQKERMAKWFEDKGYAVTWLDIKHVYAERKIE
jgi:FkbM family methyltransferase